MNKELKEWIIAIALGLAAVIIIQTFLFTQYRVSGESMSPTFSDKDRLIVSKISKTMGTIKRGDVIIFHANKENDYIKRLIGKPGDTIQYKNDVLYVNGKAVKEPYLEENKKNKVNATLTEDFSVKDLINSNGADKIPAGHYLVLGDNRANSIDSRYEVGLIDDSQIVGKVMMRLYPFNHFRLGFYPSTFDAVNK